MIAALRSWIDSFDRLAFGLGTKGEEARAALYEFDRAEAFEADVLTVEEFEEIAGVREPA